MVDPETREEHIHKIFQVEHMDNKLQESLLRCFGHVLRQPPDAQDYKRAPKVSEGVKRGQSRPKITRKKSCPKGPTISGNLKIQQKIGHSGRRKSHRQYLLVKCFRHVSLLL